MDAPDEFLCPISYDMMEDPVRAQDGFVYDRKSIERWFVSSNRSPMTNLPLVSQALLPDTDLQRAIKAFRAKHMKYTTLNFTKEHVLRRSTVAHLAATWNLTRVVVCSRANEMWQLRDDRLVQIPGTASMVAVSSDSTATAYWDEIVVRWPGHDATIVTRGQFITALALEEQTVFAGCADGIVRVYNARTPSAYTMLQGHRSSVSSMHVWGNTLITGSYDRSVRVWDVARQVCVAELHDHTRGVGCVTGQGTTVVSGSMDKTVKVWDTRSGKCTYTYGNHKGDVKAVAYVPNHNVVLSGGLHGELHMWAVGQKDASAYTGNTRHTGHITGIVVDAHGTKCVTGASDGRVVCWDFVEEMRLREAGVPDDLKEHKVHPI